MSQDEGRRPQDEPQVADGVEAADPAVAEELARGAWPASDEELEERAGGQGGSAGGEGVLHRQVPGGEESAET